MTQPTLLISAIFGCAAAAIYAYVGWRLGQRAVATPDGRLAWRLLRVWWFGLAGTTLASGLMSLLAATGVTFLPIFVVLTYFSLLLICVALWGLVYYLVYLFTGSRRWLAPLTIFYIAYGAFLMYYITASVPIRVQAEPWTATIIYRQTLTGPLVIVVLVLCCCCLVLVGGYLALTQGYLNGILPSILTPTPGAHSLLQLIA